MSSDLAAVWEVPCCDKVHTVRVHHGTISGRRSIIVDGKELIHRDWMFRLVGSETFMVGGDNRGAGVRCQLKIEPCGAFAYQYSLFVDNKPLQQYTKQKSRAMCTWLVQNGGDSDGHDLYRVVLEKDSLDVWVNGEKKEVTADFIDSGTEMRFTLGSKSARLRSVVLSADDGPFSARGDSGGGRNFRRAVKGGCFEYSLTVDGELVEPFTEAF